MPNPGHGSYSPLVYNKTQKTSSVLQQPPTKSNFQQHEDVGEYVRLFVARERGTDCFQVWPSRCRKEKKEGRERDILAPHWEMTESDQTDVKEVREGGTH